LAVNVTPMKGLWADNLDIKRSAEVEVPIMCTNIFACLHAGPLQLPEADSDVGIHMFSSMRTKPTVIFYFVITQIAGQYLFHIMFSSY
jgi:hypothetical protein